MGQFTDKAKAAGNKAAGAIKEGIGRSTNEAETVADGTAQQAKAPLKTSRVASKGRSATKSK